MSNRKPYTPPNEELLAASAPLVSPTRGKNSKVGRKLEEQAGQKITGEDRKRADFSTGKKRFTEGK